MRNSDPFDFFQDHRDTIFRWSAIAGIALVVYLILRFFAMRLGGWRAAWRRLCREVALTAYAFSAPVRSWVRHRRAVRRLVAGLGTPGTWRHAEQALMDARFAAAPAQPYAVYVAEDTVTVLLAGRNIPPVSGIWDVDPDDDAAWTAPRTQLPQVTPDAEGARPIVVTLGESERGLVFVDLAIGPPTVSVEGERRSHTALFQAIAVQLDVRLPAPQVVVSEGVHADFSGEPVRNAYRTAQATPPKLGIPAFLVTAALPDPLPPEMAEPPKEIPAMRVLLRGAGRGYVRTLLTDRHGRAAVPGTPIVATCRSLAAALARVLPHIPPVLPPAPAPSATPGFVGAELFQEARETDYVEAPAAVGSAPAAADLFEETYEIGQTADVPEAAVSTWSRAELFEESGEAARPRASAWAEETVPVPELVQIEEPEPVEVPEPAREPEQAEEPAWSAKAEQIDERALFDEPEPVVEPEPEPEPVVEAEAATTVEEEEQAEEFVPLDEPEPVVEPEPVEDAPEAEPVAEADAAEEPEAVAEPEAPAEPEDSAEPEEPAESLPPPPVGEPILGPPPPARTEYPPPAGPPVEFYPPPSGQPFSSFPPPGEARPADVSAAGPGSRGPRS